ncbi:Ankyrin repeat domain-containing protein 33B [Sarracenia purpurea var. burkii]
MPSWRYYSWRSCSLAFITRLVFIVANTAREFLAACACSSSTCIIHATATRVNTVISYAVLKNCLPIIEKLTKVPGIDVNKPDNEGNCPLHFCAQAGQVEAVNLLLNSCSGIEIDARNQYGVTPLMKAALQGRTKCAKLLLFAGASPTMRDYGRGLRAEQWARYCGRYICADMIEKYARNQLLSKTASYGNWGGEPELGLHFVNGKLQPPAIVLQNAINQSYKNNGIKSKLKKAFQRTAHPSNWNSGQRVNSFSLVTQLTSAALCVSSPVLPNSSKVSPVVKSLIRPFVIPRIEITPDSDLSPETSSIDSDSKDLSDVPKPRRKSSYFVRLRKKSFI